VLLSLNGFFSSKIKKLILFSTTIEYSISLDLSFLCQRFHTQQNKTHCQTLFKEEKEEGGFVGW